MKTKKKSGQSVTPRIVVPCVGSCGAMGKFNPRSGMRGILESLVCRGWVLGENARGDIAAACGSCFKSTRFDATKDYAVMLVPCAECGLITEADPRAGVDGFHRSLGVKGWILSAIDPEGSEWVAVCDGCKGNIYPAEALALADAQFKKGLS